MTESEHSNDVLVTAYSVSISDDFTAEVTLELTGSAGHVTITSEITARDTQGRITRTVTVTGPRGSTTLSESDLRDWRPSNTDVCIDSRALRAAINVQYIGQSEAWYRLYQQKAPETETGAPGVEVAE